MRDRSEYFAMLSAGGQVGYAFGERLFHAVLFRWGSRLQRLAGQFQARKERETAVMQKAVEGKWKPQGSERDRDWHLVTICKLGR